MGKQEIKTITEAMVKKQTWLRKSLTDFLKVWAEITKDGISGHYRFVLYDYIADSDGRKHRAVLKRGLAQLDGDVYNDGWCTHDYYTDISDISIETIKTIISAIDKKLPAYFEAIQADIDNIDVLAEKINGLVKKLS